MTHPAEHIPCCDCFLCTIVPPLAAAAFVPCCCLGRLTTTAYEVRGSVCVHCGLGRVRVLIQAVVSRAGGAYVLLQAWKEGTSREPSGYRCSAAFVAPSAQKRTGALHAPVSRFWYTNLEQQSHLSRCPIAGMLRVPPVLPHRHRALADVPAAP